MIEKDFLHELKVLLEKYDADIAWTCALGSDTHGIYEEAIVVSVKNKEVFRTEPGKGFLESRDIELS